MSNPKYLQFVTKLNRLTQEDKLTWDKGMIPADMLNGTDSIIVSFYRTVCEGRNIGIYEEKFQGYNPMDDIHFWDNRIVLALYDDNWQLDWAFPLIPGLWELMETVRFKSSGVDDFLDSALQ